MAYAQDVLRGGLYLYEVSNSEFIFTPRDARAEYARLRKIANRRLERLGASEFANGRTYQNYSSGFQALPPDMEIEKVRKALYDVAHFVNLKTSSVSGARAAREKFIAKMHELGYDFINKSNAVEFGEFMRDVKTHETYRGYDSDRVVMLFNSLKEKRISTEDAAQYYEYWMKHKSQLDAAPRSNKTVSSKEFAKMRKMPAVRKARQPKKGKK